ncbi:hypothetical protein [Mycolicibacterium sp. XJ870]
MTYRLHVVAANAADVAAHAAGLIVDRVMGGWRVTAALADPSDTRTLRILGVELLDAEAEAELDDDRCVLAIDAKRYADAASGDTRGLLSQRAEVLVWGGAPETDHSFEHRLSTAGRAFKAQALAAAGFPSPAVGLTENFASAGSWGKGDQALASCFCS